ncbi:MAG: HAD-IA family hydrolase [Proteobacteria bacterium]|nr:HAD-IA family hydrolase [Pseudomonadota bacterium]
MINTPAVLFDLDGTLLDTAPEFTYCLNQLLTAQGKQPVTVESLRSSVSFGAKGMLCFGFKLHRQDPLLDELLPRFLSLYQEKIGHLTELFPGMAEILSHLGEKGIPWGIVTNKPLCFAKPLVQVFKPLQATQCLIGGDSLPEQKPHPAPLLQGAALLNVAPIACWYIGDAKTDLEASRKANMRCAIANYGYIPPEEDVYSWEADSYLEKPSDIEKILFA